MIDLSKIDSGTLSFLYYKKIEDIYQQFLNNRVFRQRMCHCKTQLLEAIVSTGKASILHITACMIMLKKIRHSVSEEDCLFSKWFSDTLYREMFLRKDISKKYLAIFYHYQYEQDKIFFNLLSASVKRALTERRQDEFRNRLSEILEIQKNWIESYGFNIASVNLNCNNIDDSILDTVPYEKTSITFCYDRDVAPCDLHRSLQKEFIHVVVLPEHIENYTFLDHFKTTIKKYHKQPDQIRWIFDFRLIQNSVIDGKLSSIVEDIPDLWFTKVCKTCNVEKVVSRNKHVKVTDDYNRLFLT